MSFLAPALLAGLAAIAIPIIVHLVQRERRRVVEFPSLMFLRKIPYQSVRRRAIRHWPLLLLRAAALALIAVAFARPFTRSDSVGAPAAGGGREVVILLDRSFSMGYGDHWSRAQAEASRVVGALGPVDRATLVLFAADAELAVRSSADRGALLGAIDRARPSAAGTRYGPALRAASGLLESSGLPRREVVLISDYQEAGWDRAEDDRLAPGVILTPVSVGEPGADNAGVVGLTLERRGPAGRELVSVSARIVNHGAAPLSDRQITLDIDGRRADARRVSVQPRSAAMVTFAAVAVGARPALVTARLEPDRLPTDDVFHAVVSPAAAIQVLILESANPAPDSTLYLAGALAVGRTPPFEIRVTPVDRATPVELDAAAVIVLNDSRPPTAAAGRALDRRVRAGAGLMVVLGGQAGWPPDAPQLLPGTLEGIIDRSGTRGGALGYVDYAHPVFEIFRQPRSGDLTAPHLFRYRRLAPSGAVIARFDDGAAALVERRVERGIVLAWTSTLDSHWNDFALTPVFVPFVHEAVKHLARFAEPRAWLTVGEPLDPMLVAAPGGLPVAADVRDLVVVSPGGHREPLGLNAAVSGAAGPVTSGPGAAGDGTARARPLDEQGFYAIRPASPGASDVAAVAVNVSAAESDLALLDPEEIVRAIGAAGAPTEAPGQAAEHGATELERRQSLWWYVLAVGLVLLLIEGLVAGRLPRVA